MLIELLDCIAIDVLEKVRRRTNGGLTMMAIILRAILVWLLFNPKVLGWLEIISEN
jgi:hypothetical protein